MTFNIGLSGLKAASQDLAVISNNIANVNSFGFKGSRAEFADIYNREIGGLGSNAGFLGKLGGGVRLASVSQLFSQGNFELTGRSLDFAINGNGFFVVKDQSTGENLYTRAGAFRVDREGYVENAFNQRLQVYSVVDATIPTFNTGSTSDLQLPPEINAPSATSTVDIALNLDTTAEDLTGAPAFTATDATTYNNSTSFTAYDSLGEPHTVTLFFRKEGTNWETFMQIDGTDVGANNTLTFDSSGTLTAAMPFNWGTYTLSNGAADLNINVDFTGTTYYGANFAVNDLVQDGYPPGRLVSMEVSDQGIVQARYSNGQATPLGQIALATFANAQGLEQVGNTTWASTYASGDPLLGISGSGGVGVVEAGGLEQSNVDMSEELVNLITAQRNFQANAQVISANDTITQAILNI